MSSVFNFILDKKGVPTIPRAFDTILSKRSVKRSSKAIFKQRCDLLTQLTWTPIVEDAYPATGGTHFETVEQKGLPYSSTRGVGRTIGFDVSFYTFYTAILNPLSIVYTEDLRTPPAPNYIDAGTAGGYYGLVCSEFLAYAHGLSMSFTSGQFTERPEAALAETQDAQFAEIGDFLWRPGHVAAVSGVTKDQNGTVTHVEVSEASFPKMVRRSYTTSSFNQRLNGDTLYKFPISDDLEYNHFEVPDLSNYTLMLDRGDKTVYEKDSLVKYNVTDSNSVALVIEKDGEEIETVSLDGATLVERSYSEEGLYKAHVARSDSSTSNEVQFIVASVDVSIPTTNITAGEPFSINFSGIDCAPIYVIIQSPPDVYSFANFPPYVLTEAEQESNTVTVDHNVPGEYDVRVCGETPFGRVRSNRIRITVS